ncbi:MAG: Rieske (2Fe-2S) protein [Myxococcales bacterium]|nr:Rieske (2Fe-2S) protein [Myxococcales bacterium]
MYTPFFPLSDLAPGAMKAREGVVVVRVASGELHALDNACPHQGYPLAQGQLCGKVLTCSWHNFKFDITNGACVMGEEAARIHDVRVVDGIVEVDRRTGMDTAAAWASLGQAMSRHQGSRIAREVARLLTAGVAPRELLAWGAMWDADRGEYGPGHAMALASTLCGWVGGGLEHDVQVVAEALDLAAEAVRGLPLRVRPEPQEGDAADPGSRAELRRRVETEDALGAEALVRGMVARGASREDWEAALYPLVTHHFLDFGHPLIYIGKLQDLLGAAPNAAQPLQDSLLGALVFGITNGTREDTLPPWAGFRRRYAAATGLADRAHAHRQSGEPPLGEPTVDLVTAIAFGTPGVCFDAVATALLDGGWAAVVNALSMAASMRLLRFDIAHDADPTLEEGWLDITHRLTVANAVRRAVARWNSPGCAQLVLMAAHFVNLGKALDRTLPASGVPGDLLAALREHRPDDAAASISSLDDVTILRFFVLEGHAVRPVFFAHHVKTVVAAAEEAQALADLAPLRAFARFLASPLQERLTRRFAHQAVRLVRDAKPPRGLTG